MKILSSRIEPMSRMAQELTQSKAVLIKKTTLSLLRLSGLYCYSIMLKCFKASMMAARFSGVTSLGS